jgi:hypothetical protein
MKRNWWLGILVLAAVAGPAGAQEPVKPTKEHAVFKQLEGNWEATINADGQQSKAEYTAKLDAAGLWLITTFKAQTFEGHGIDGYDSAKKKYVGVWVDTMQDYVMNLEGAYDEKTQTLTMEGTAKGMDGKPTKVRMTSKMPNKDTIEWAMFMPADSQQPMLTITYKRKK